MLARVSSPVCGSERRAKRQWLKVLKVAVKSVTFCIDSPTLSKEGWEECKYNHSWRISVHEFQVPFAARGRAPRGVWLKVLKVAVKSVTFLHLQPYLGGGKDARADFVPV